MTSSEKNRIITKLDKIDNTSVVGMVVAVGLIAKALSAWVHLQVVKEKTSG